MLGNVYFSRRIFSPLHRLSERLSLIAINKAFF